MMFANMFAKTLLFGENGHVCVRFRLESNSQGGVRVLRVRLIFVLFPCKSREIEQNRAKISYIWPQSSCSCSFSSRITHLCSFSRCYSPRTTHLCSFSCCYSPRITHLRCVRFRVLVDSRRTFRRWYHHRPPGRNSRIQSLIYH